MREHWQGNIQDTATLLDLIYTGTSPVLYSDAAHAALSATRDPATLRMLHEKAVRGTWIFWGWIVLFAVVSVVPIAKALRRRRMAEQR